MFEKFKYKQGKVMDCRGFLKKIRRRDESQPFKLYGGPTV